MDASFGRETIAVWYCLTEGLGANALEPLNALLSPDERARRDRFHFDRDRRDFVAAHGLLRRALSHYGEKPPEAWAFNVDSYGKPALTESETGAPRLLFNLTHTRGLVACAVAREGQVGIDAEMTELATATPELASQCFAVAEQQLLQGRDRGDYTATFAELWTLKEAYIKAVGAGLSLPLHSFHFTYEGRDRLRFDGPADGHAWQFVLAAPSPVSRISIAVASTDAARRWDYTFRDLTPEPVHSLRILRRSHPSREV